MLIIDHPFIMWNNEMKLPESLTSFLEERGFKVVDENNNGIRFSNGEEEIDIAQRTENYFTFLWKIDRTWNGNHYFSQEELKNGILEQFKNSFVRPPFYNVE